MDNDWLGFFNRNRLSINLPERLPVPSPSYSAGLEFELTGVAQGVELA
jgi:hypothetical protein